MTAHRADASARRPIRLRFNVEFLLYSVIVALAGLTRFWDLSSRAQHHDESLHSYFSWLYAVGEGYIHDPMMHGPTLFHTNALAYLLFGDNDYTSRLWPAMLGVVLVLMPVMLRGPRLLGRWGALTCSVLLLFSPSLLYQSRYLRHDPIVLVTTLAIVIAALRYLERPESKWIITVGIMAGLLFATMEVSFIIAFVLVTFVAGIALWQISRLALGLMILTGAGVLAVVKIMSALGAPGLPGIPWENPSSSNIRAFSWDLATHPIVLSLLGVVLLGAVLILGALDRVRDRSQRNWIESVFAPAPDDTTARAFFNLIRDRRSLWIAISLGLMLFATFYTSMFTNMFGLGSGTVGALGYWLGQQGVQRADQPWFYYLLMLPQYELVAVALFPVGVVLTARRLIPAIRRNEPVGRRNYMRGLFIYWALVNIAIFSWAGEKMPWLTVHMALPMILLAASVIGGAIERLEATIRRRELPARMLWLVGAGIPLVSAAWFALWAWGSAGPWEERDGFLQRSLRPGIAEYPWLLYLPILALLALTGFAILKLGSRLALPIVALAFAAVVLAGQIHTSFRLTYFEGDIPVDMLIYVQTSPDVPRVVEEIGKLSREMTGGKDLPIAYDSGTSWPFQWYLRDYSQRRFFGTTLNEPPDEPIVLVSNEYVFDGNNEQMLAGYTYTEYVMRWWFPEDETYRRFAIAPELKKTERQNYQTDEPGPYSVLDVAESVWRSVWGLREPQQQAKMFRLVSYRELWAPIGSYNFRVYVRNDLLQNWDDLRY